jgi:drug/metabolite transporter (DMT)-like permease
MEQNKLKQNMFAGVIALIGIVLFSAKSVFAKMVYSYNIDPVTTIYLRMLFSLPFVAIIGIWYEKKHKKDFIHWKDVISVVLISILGYYISSILDFVGLVYVEAAIERLIMFLYPTMVIVLSALFLKKRINIQQIIAIIIAYCGIIIAFADKLLVRNSSLFWYGAILIALSSLTYSIFLVLSDGLIARLGSIRFTTIATLTMCIGIISHATFTGKAHLYGYNNNVYLISFLMALISTVIPVYMFNYAIGKLGSSSVSIISCAGPVCTLLYSSLLLSEIITLYQIIGTVIVIAGILIIYIRKYQEATVLKNN